jgi:hypothetical protein
MGTLNPESRVFGSCLVYGCIAWHKTISSKKCKKGLCDIATYAITFIEFGFQL